MLGKLTKPLPGYRSLDGQWKFSRDDIAEAWQQQFADIENAETVAFDDLLTKSKPNCEARTAEQLLEMPYNIDGCGKGSETVELGKKRQV